MVFITTMLTTAEVKIHALIAKYGIDIQLVRPEMPKFKMFRVKVNMDFYFVVFMFQLQLFFCSIVTNGTAL
jgi:hypothetical protein